METGRLSPLRQRSRKARGRSTDSVLMAVRKQHKRRGDERGVQSVRCRICRQRLRVISGRHLSKHGIERETYMEEYGLTPDDLIAKDFRSLRSSRPEFVPNGKSEWLRAIKEVHRKGGDVTARYLQKKQPHLYRQGVWIFGDWDKALIAAGLDPECARIRQSWDEELVIKRIRGLREQRLPLYASYVAKRHAGLFHKSIETFGSWNAAVAAAAVFQNLILVHSGRPEILRQLRDGIENASTNGISEILRVQAEYYFGSLDEALAALKN
jgi:hypothetical protein